MHGGRIAQLSILRLPLFAAQAERCLPVRGEAPGVLHIQAVEHVSPANSEARLPGAPEIQYEVFSTRVRRLVSKRW